MHAVVTHVTGAAKTSLTPYGFAVPRNHQSRLRAR
jgi:hypothetical protein